MRGDEKDFFLRKETQYLTRHEQAMREIYQEIEDLEAMMVKENQAGIVEKIREFTRAYESGFKIVAGLEIEQGLDENNGLLGKLRDAVHRVEVTLKEYRHIVLTNQMLMMRRHEKDFLARKDEKYVKRLTRVRDEFLHTLEGSDIPGEERKKIIEQIVGSVKQVGDIVAEIAAASVEQSSGILQVNQAVMQMDKMTQQNAALAEQASAASLSMREQAEEMGRRMGFFQLTG